MVHVAVATSAIIACSAAMVKAVTLARRLAPLPRPILLVGETGVGKRLLARFIHSCSGRPGDFVAVAGGELSEALLHGEFAGHEPGAFASAHRRLRGPFEQAQSGTLFLDELPLWPVAVQSMVLRALDEGLIARRGTERELPVSWRLIVASQRALGDLMDDGRLLPALRWWLGEFVIAVPSLRGRFVDIAALSYHFLDRVREELCDPGPALIDPEALDRLVTYRWPGNVRQLRSVVEWSWVQGAASAAERIRTADLPPSVAVDSGPRVAVDLEGRRALSRWAFERAGRNRRGAGRLLGVHPNTIDNHRRAAAP
jgi:DNA-binding NtrC family response regulator